LPEILSFYLQGSAWTYSHRLNDSAADPKPNPERRAKRRWRERNPVELNFDFVARLLHFQTVSRADHWMQPEHRSLD
jgi:hypothetical protein